MTTVSRLNGWPICSPADASPTPSRTPAHGSGPMWVATPSSQWTDMGIFGSSGQVHRHIKKLRWLFRYPRSEPYSMTWLVPHQIKLTSGRRSKQLHQYPAFGGWGSGGRDHSFTRLFKPVLCSVPIAWIRQDRLGPGDWGGLCWSVCAQMVFITAPSMTTPPVEYFHNATRSLRASATIVVLRILPPLLWTRS